MPPSYRKINYSIRLAKTIERRMLCDIFTRLYPFERVEAYRYVGFGSIYFSDFALFHRALGISDMLSIEKDSFAIQCFEFNRPYGCIKLEFRSSNEVLPSLDWSRKTIAWLDYDGPLDEAVLSDVRTVCARACSGTMLVLSVNAQPESPPSQADIEAFAADAGQMLDIDEYRLRVFRQRLGGEIPSDIKGSHLRGQGVSVASARIIRDVIHDALSARNAALVGDKRMEYQQVLNLNYQDGALMLTLGGVFYEVGDAAKLAACGMNELSFVRPWAEAFSIKVPCLTLKEMRHLNVTLPQVEGIALALPPGVPAKDGKAFAELYRYFPAFAETVLP